MLPYLFVLFAIAVRFVLPHTGGFHFTPVAASLLFFGSSMPRKQLWIPVTMFIASDVLLSRFQYGYPISASDLVTWSWYAAIVLFGSLLANNVSPMRVAGASLTASFSFYAVSNLAVWAVWDMYPKTLAGLADCYVAAIPFFRNSLVSDMLFAAIFFGIAALAPRLVPAKATHRLY